MNKNIGTVLNGNGLVPELHREKRLPRSDEGVARQYCRHLGHLDVHSRHIYVVFWYIYIGGDTSGRWEIGGNKMWEIGVKQI